MTFFQVAGFVLAALAVIFSIPRVNVAMQCLCPWLWPRQDEDIQTQLSGLEEKIDALLREVGEIRTEVARLGTRLPDVEMGQEDPVVTVSTSRGSASAGPDNAQPSS